jgi:hypothetical protein
MQSLIHCGGGLAIHSSIPANVPACLICGTFHGPLSVSPNYIRNALCAYPMGHPREFSVKLTLTAVPGEHDICDRVPKPSFSEKSSESIMRFDYKSDMLQSVDESE